IYHQINTAKIYTHHLLLYQQQHPSTSPLFPYTTLFRSLGRAGRSTIFEDKPPREAMPRSTSRSCSFASSSSSERTPILALDADRSEEHTSELQSLRHLVCRLLLEKKKNNISTQHNFTKL